MADRARVLIIEDESPIRRFLKASFDADYHVLDAESGAAGLRAAAHAAVDLILLDLGLPDMDGVEVVRHLREWSQVPVIVLSARDQERDKIAALDAGADDYLTKPFSPGELMARMRATLRRSQPDPSANAVFVTGEFRLDFAAHTVIVRGQEVHLTPNEYKLLALLVRHAGKLVTHKQLLTEVWGPAYANENHYLRVYMAQLRHKLEADPARPRLLITEPGVGYRLRTE